MSESLTPKIARKRLILFVLSLPFLVLAWGFGCVIMIGLLHQERFNLTAFVCVVFLMIGISSISVVSFKDARILYSLAKQKSGETS